MAVVSSDVPFSHDEFHPRCIASKFVNQYYFCLETIPFDVHKFYKEQSVITRKGSKGEMVTMTTVENINNEIMSSDYKGCSFDPTTFDVQTSLMGGLLVTLMGNVTGVNKVTRKFNQTFFLSQQTTGFFVLNDILRIWDPLEQVTVPAVGTDVVDSADDLIDKKTPTIQPKEVTEAVKVSSDVPDVKVSDVKKSLTITIGETVLNIATNEEDASPVVNCQKTVSDTKDNFVENESKDKITQTDLVASTEHQEAKKISYASMVTKQAQVISPTNISGPKIVRVAPNADQQLSTATVTPTATPMSSPKDVNNIKKEHIASSAAPNRNNGHGPTDALGLRSIYIANLPHNVTKDGLADALKIFGPIKEDGIQISRVHDDGFCYGFVDFESASSASKAVEVHHVVVGANEAYMMYKKSTGSRSMMIKNGNGGYYGRSRNDNPKNRDNQESHGNGTQMDNQAAVDTRSQPNEENDWQNHHRGGRGMHSRNNRQQQPSNERPRRNGYPRGGGDRRNGGDRNGDAYPRRYNNNYNNSNNRQQ